MDDVGLADAQAFLKEIEGAYVNMCCFDYSVRLSFSGSSASAGIAIASPFELRVDGSAHAIEPERLGEHVAPALRLFMRTVESATIDDERVLTIRFVPDATLTIVPAAHYESWDFHTSAGSRVICHPSRFSIVGTPAA